MKIEISRIWRNRDGRMDSWFHPRACAMTQTRLRMTLQSIGGSDFYGAIHESVSNDAGHVWSIPEPVPGLGWHSLNDGISEGVCDMVPVFHEPTQTVLAIGHNVYYRNGELFDSLGDWKTRDTGSLLRRFPVSAILDASGCWKHVREKVRIPGFEECSMCSCGSSQWIFERNDEVLIPFTFGEFERRDRRVCSARFRYDGETLTFLKRGNILENPVDRGLLEPSVIRFDGRYLLTLRAEDGRGYHAESVDGILWDSIVPWAFDDGEILCMSSTQQHWLRCGGKLFLVYTRDCGNNHAALRFRAPLLLAEVDQNGRLKRETEQTVFPLISEDGSAAGMGNFHVTEITDCSALILVGEERHFCGYRGDTLCAFCSI